MPAAGPGHPLGPGPDGSTSERGGRNGSLRGPNAKRPSSLNILASLNKKRKASDMEETEDFYNATHIRFPIKQEPGLPIEDSPGSRGSTGPSIVPIKQEPSTDSVLPGRDSDNSNSQEDQCRPSSRLDEPLPMVKEEADSPDHDSRAVNDVEDRASSQDLSEPNMWDVSESEFRTSETEEDSSDGESAGSAFSLRNEREDSGEPDESSRGPDNISGEESDPTSSRRRTVQNQNSNSRQQASEMTANGSNITQRDTPSTRTLHDHGNPIRDESSESPENRRNTRTTTAGKPRQRAAAKTHISARDISRSWKTANSADKMLVKMKEKGCDWLEIRKAWQELTGEWPAASTLPNRYKRVKDNLTRLRSGDGQRLLNAAADVEAQFQREKWRLIADAMERAGAAKYSNAFIQKKYDELSRNPSMFDTLIDDESSDASGTDPTPRGINVARLQQPEAESTMARAQERSENPHGSSHAHPALSGTATRDGVQSVGNDEPPGSGHRQKGGPSEGPKVAFSREQAKHMAKQRALIASDHGKPRPYECKSCLGRYKKRSGLGAHWKRNPGCDPETRRCNAAKTVSKDTAAERARGASNSEAVAEGSSHMPETQMIFEISSKEPTPEIGGKQS